MEGEDVDHQDAFPTETAGLPEAASPSLVRLYDGDSFDLRILPVRKRIEDAEVRMLGYNGSIPGTTLHVDRGSGVTVRVTNDGDVEATVHWHGLRLENRYDGVPEETQALIPTGGTFTYRVRFPDPGFYWYHPHVREDFAQEMGLYAPIVVEPSEPSYWPHVDRQLTITLDDVLFEEGRMAPFRRSGPTFTAMGRFGNVMLINGESEFSGEAAHGEVVRLYLVNTANTRIFNFALSGARMKLVGGDSGRYEHETCCSLPRSERSSTYCSIHPERCASSTAPRNASTSSARSRSRALRPEEPQNRSRCCEPILNSPPNVGRSSTTSSGHQTRCSRWSPRCRFCTGERPRQLLTTLAPCTPRLRPLLQGRARSAA
jgi:FtsP/CotA-like multicopper oxidase with cupredoxin domain